MVHKLQPSESQSGSCSQNGTSAQTRSRVAERGFSRRPERGIPVEKPKEGKKTLRRLLSYFRRQLPLVVLMFLVVCTGVIASVLAPGFQSSAIDRIIAGDYGGISPYLKDMLIAYLVYGGCLLLQGYISAWLSQRVVMSLRRDLFNRMIRLPVSYLDRHSHGDLMSRMTNDAENISSVISESMSSLFSGILTLIGTLVMMLYYSVPLALISCSTIIATVLITTFMTKKMQHYYVRRQILLGQVNGITEEMIGNLRTITAYNRQEEVIETFSQTSDSLTHTGIISEIVSGSMGPIMNMLGNVSFVLVAVFGAWFALRGSITVGVISAFLVYARQFSRPINEISQLYGQIQTALAGAERIFEILDVPEEKTQGEPPTQPVKGTIEFKHVNFSYVPGKQIIRDFSLKVEAGKKIALVGATGSGKTTIINLLMRFYEPDSGQILLDGKDIQSLDLYQLRRCIGIVLQDSVLFSGSVRDNLTYGYRLGAHGTDAFTAGSQHDSARGHRLGAHGTGTFTAGSQHSPARGYRPHARRSGAVPGSENQYTQASAAEIPPEEFEALTHASNADKVAMSLPDGYDTILSESGASLSAGQRQLLTIGRAFLAGPDILILDEATSSVDTRTEQNIQDAMVRLMKGRTSLIIAHRLSTIQDADEIIVMDQGQIVEQGSHRQLLERHGRYYDLYMTQFAGRAT